MATVTTPSSYKSRIYRDILFDLTVSSKNKVLSSKELIPWWRSDVTGNLYGQAFWDIDRGGVISGSFKDPALIAIPYAVIALYDRSSGLLINKTLTNTLGQFEFRGLDRYSNNYYVLALDTPYNAQIFDRVTPS